MAQQWYSKKGSNICGGRQQAVKVLKIGEILRQELEIDLPLRIPLYQRRYCWNDSAISLLFHDVKKQIGKKFPHRFNRMILSHQNDHVMVVDGQQRLTSFCLFLAAIRDVFEQDLPFLRDEINNILFPRGVPENPKSFDDIHFVLSPTYLDRPVFYQILFPFLHNDNSNSFSSNSFRLPVDKIDKKFHSTRAFRAYQIFVKLLCLEKENHGLDFGPALTNALLNNCSALYFEIYDENVWEVFERMGAHTYYWEKNSMGRSLAETDFIRNCILSQFQSEEKQIEIFTQYWLPLEEQACRGNDVTMNFDQLFRDFISSLENQSHEELGLGQKFGLYNLIRPYLVVENEDKVQNFLDKLMTFSKKWFVVQQNSTTI